jgi:predicted transcriptional regulator
MKNNLKPTEAELEILQVLWGLGACTVRTVNDELSKRKGVEIGYTTTLKIMQLMYEKGLVKRNDEGKTHIYEAAVSESATKTQLVDKFVDAVFGGSALKMVMQALGGKQSNTQEISEIRRFLEEMENKQDEQDHSNKPTNKGGAK